MAKVDTIVINQDGDSKCCNAMGWKRTMCADRCWCTTSVDSVPNECLECVFCESRDEMYMEMPVGGDWRGRGFVARIGCLCNTSLDEENRTEFGVISDLVEDWNFLQGEIIKTIE